MGQVWSKADFDGVLHQGNQGGRGSCLAVTAQNSGPDGQWDTGDDVLEPLNADPLNISTDASTSSSDIANPLDRVRGFYSYHPGGANFVRGDGSVSFITETIAARPYRSLSTISGGEISGEY
jgi:prepilin-type processing-associated H-X9-DG protein